MRVQCLALCTDSYVMQVFQTMDATGTAPAVVYPLPGGGDIPSFPVSISD